MKEILQIKKLFFRKHQNPNTLLVNILKIIETVAEKIFKKKSLKRRKKSIKNWVLEVQPYRQQMNRAYKLWENCGKNSEGPEKQSYIVARRLYHKKYRQVKNLQQKESDDRIVTAFLERKDDSSRGFWKYIKKKLGKSKNYCPKKVDHALGQEKVAKLFKGIFSDN